MALAITSGALGLLQALGSASNHLTEMATLVVANGLATIVRFLLLRTWMAPARATRAGPLPMLSR